MRDFFILQVKQIFDKIKQLFSFAFLFMAYNDKHIQIIETAEALFAKKGYEATTVRDIAIEAGVNIAMISYYFGSKEKLLEALFNHRMGNLKMRVESLLQNDSLSPIQKIDILIDEHIERVIHHEGFYKIMLCEQVINKNPVIIKMVLEIKKRNAGLINELIVDGQKKGTFKRNVDVLLLMSTMVGTVIQALINSPFYREYN
ncbi:MAG: TetR/AcrR family transcriptional regulator, partial [Chitinophagaceae bacterium]|nr:TetR/AcrR family transcriptional regulator [Chitinophagaceae bacterium]